MFVATLIIAHPTSPYSKLGPKFDKKIIGRNSVINEREEKALNAHRSLQSWIGSIIEHDLPFILT